MIDTINMILIRKYDSTPLMNSAGEYVDHWLKDRRNYEKLQTECDKIWNHSIENPTYNTERLSHRAFDIVVDIVLKGTYYTTLAAGKNWIAKKQPGTFLNIVTTYAWTGSGYVVPSACSKAGVLALTRSLVVEWAKYSIRSNAIAPGPFPTEGAWSRLLPGDLVKKFDPAQRIPLKRVGEHQDWRTWRHT